MYKIIKIEPLKSPINKYDVSIVIKYHIKLEDLKNTIEKEIIPKLKKQYDFDELYIGFFEDENLIGYGTTLGYVICSPTGEFTGKHKLNKDLSNMKIGYSALENFEHDWNNRLTHKESIIFKDIRESFTKEETNGELEKENIVIDKVANNHHISSKDINKVIYKHAKHFCK